MNALQQIRDKRADLARQRAALERQDAELAIAEKVVAEMASEPMPGAQTAPTPVLTPLPRQPLAPSRREKVVEALSGEKIWMTSAEINLAIARRHQVLLKTNSLFPMLTNLKKEGVIMREGDKMALKSRAEETIQPM